MKALFLVEPGKTEIREVKKPSLGEGQVLLKVSKVGFCGGDLNGFRGTFALQEYPVILGHEIGAVIEEVDGGVPENLRAGMHVTVSPYKNCGTCFSCRRGFPNACQDNRTMGVRRPGAMTRYVAVSWQDIYCSEKLTPVELALVEPLTVGFHAINRGRIDKDYTVLVLGCGIVGMGAIASAAMRGAKVIAVDIDDRKIAIARKAGAQYGINSTKTELAGGVMKITDNQGPMAVVEAIGNPATFKLAVEIVAFTGTVVYIGYAKTPVEYDTKKIVQKELNIYGSRNCLGDFPEVIKMLETGRFPVRDVISKTVSLEEAGNSLAKWSENPGGYLKIMVDLEGQD
jgi:threonine dehydrogenase-like Zn-dependent dehydrogenase